MKERSQSQALCKLKPTCFKYLNVKKPETLGAILGGKGLFKLEAKVEITKRNLKSSGDRRKDGWMDGWVDRW
jgi:hypothetical protein